MTKYNDHLKTCSRYTTVLADSVPGLCDCGFDEKTSELSKVCEELRKNVLIVHYDSHPSLITMDRKVAEKELKENIAEWPVLRWKISTIEEYGHTCYEIGEENGYADGSNQDEY